MAYSMTQPQIDKLAEMIRKMGTTERVTVMTTDGEDSIPAVDSNGVVIRRELDHSFATGLMEVYHFLSGIFGNAFGTVVP